MLPHESVLFVVTLVFVCVWWITKNNKYPVILCVKSDSEKYTRENSSVIKI